MSTGYTRQSAAEIIPSAVVRSSSFNNELNKIRDAFKFSTDGSTGHTHDGSSDKGSYIPLVADVDANNKVVVDGSTNRISFYNEVSSSPVEQVRFEDGVIKPVTDNDVDLGTSTLKFKHVYTKSLTLDNGFASPVNANDPVTLQFFTDTLTGTSPTLRPVTWQSAGTYTTGDTVFSPINFLVYESLTDHTGLTTDPSLDGTNWSISSDIPFPATGGTFTGEVTFGAGVNENHTTVTSTSNALTIDCDLGNDFTHVLTENTTVSFTDPPASGSSFGFSLEIVQDASASGYTVTWPASVRWPFAIAPALTSTASAVDVFVFKTDDAGTTWYGFFAGQAMGVPV